MTQAEQPPSTAGPAAGAPPGVPGKRGQDEEPAAPPKDWPLWLWPPLAVALVALGGYRFGIDGALTAAGSAISALVFVAGDFLYAGHRRRALAVLAVSLGAIAVVGLMWETHVPFSRLPTATQSVGPGPVDLRGRTITQKQVPGIDLRGAQLAGSVLNGLNLRTKQMQGADARGASFSHADLSFASLRGADLSGADFSYACLIGTDLTGAILNGADVSHATLDIRTLPSSVVNELIGTPVNPRAHETKCPTPAAG